MRGVAAPVESELASARSAGDFARIAGGIQADAEVRGKEAPKAGKKPAPERKGDPVGLAPPTKGPNPASWGGLSASELETWTFEDIDLARQNLIAFAKRVGRGADMLTEGGIPVDEHRVRLTVKESEMAHSVESHGRRD